MLKNALQNKTYLTILKNLLLDNLGLKLWSLLLAFILWMFLQEQHTIEGFAKVPVQLLSRPTNLIVTNDVSEAISLRMRGSHAQIRAVQKDGFFPAYRLNLEGIESGSTLYRIFPTDFKVPAGVQITRITPQVLQIVAEAQETKSVRINPSLRGKLEEGFRLVSTKTDPAFVAVAGARGEVRALQEVPTAFIDLTGVRNSFKGEYPLLLKEGGNVWLESEIAVAKVAVEIVEDKVALEVKDVRVQVQGTASEHQLVPETVKVTIEGPAGKVHDYINAAPVATVSAQKLVLGKARQRTFRVPVNLNPGADLRVKKIVPRLADLTLFSKSSDSAP